MAKKKKTADSAIEKLTFEQSLEQLEQIVAELESGQTGLTEALEKYELGIQHLKHCHRELEAAERKVSLLSGFDAEGNPVTEAFDDEEWSLEKKQKSRHRRRSRGSGTSAEESRENGDMDEPRGLF